MVLCAVSSGENNRYSRWRSVQHGLYGTYRDAQEETGLPKCANGDLSRARTKDETVKPCDGCAGSTHPRRIYLTKISRWPPILLVQSTYIQYRLKTCQNLD